MFTFLLSLFLHMGPAPSKKSRSLLKSYQENLNKCANRRRSARNFYLILSQDDDYFLEHFRISKNAFMAICSFIQSLGFYLPSERYKSRRRMVTVHHAVAMLLLFIGHGCSHKITGAFCEFAKETVCFHVSKMRSIFMTHVAPNCIRWPSSDEEIQKSSRIFLIEGILRMR